MIYFVTNQLELFDAYPDFKHSSLEDMVKHLHYHHTIAIDTETEGFDPHTCGLIYLQIGTPTNQYVIDIATVDISPLKEVLESRKLIMHNAKFDLRFLFKQGFIPTDIFDTFIVETVLTTGMKKPAGYRGLDECLQRYLGVKLQKEVRDLIQRERYSAKVIEYSAKDVEYLHDLMQEQIKALEKHDLLNCAKLENKFVVVLAYIEYEGIYLDQARWKAKMKKDKEELNRLEEELNNWVLANYSDSSFVSNQLSLFESGLRCTINWNSDKQVLNLFTLIGIDTWDEKDSKNSVNMNILISQINDFEILKIYIPYSKTSKLVSTFGQTMLDSVNKATGRIHTSFRQIKDTGRMSCGDRRQGLPNLQQVPADERHRSCFTAEDNNKIIVCDYASQESRILADISKEPNLVKFYTEGGADLHSYAAQVVYKELATVTLDDIKKYHKDKRQIMKGFNFALAYGGTGETVSRNLNIPIDIAKRAEEDYFKAFNGLKKYFEIAKKKPLLKGYVLIDPVTRRKSFIDFFDKYIKAQAEISQPRFWENYRDSKEKNDANFTNYYQPTVREYFYLKGKIERKGLNYVIQGTAASQTKYAGIKLFNWIVENNLFGIVKIPNLVHDEIVVECPENSANHVKQKVKLFMEEGANHFMQIIPMIAEPEISSHWKK